MKTAKRPTLPRRRFILLLAALGVSTSIAGAVGLPSGWSTGAATNRPIRVACVGDSITFGYGLRHRAQDSYPAVLSRLLGPGWNVRNFGVSATTLLHKGDRPYIKTKAYGEALDFKPDAVVIMLGTNDSKHPNDGTPDSKNAVDNWQYKADFVPNYKELIAAFRRANPPVKVYVCLPTPCFPGRWGISNQTIHDQIIPLTRQVAKVENASIIDLNSALAGKKDLFQADTVHPNPAGAKLMARTIYQALTGKPAPAGAQ